MKALERDSVGFQMFVQSYSVGASTVLNDATTRFGMGIGVGADGRVSVTFTTGEYTDYAIYFGMQGSGACLIDNLSITKVNA